MHLDEASLSPEVGREGIQLWLVPPLFHGRRFDELFISMQVGMRACARACAWAPH